MIDVFNLKSRSLPRITGIPIGVLLAVLMHNAGEERFAIVSFVSSAALVMCYPILRYSRSLRLTAHWFLLWVRNSRTTARSPC